MVVDWHGEWQGDDAQPVLVLLHGFAGSSRTWDDVLPFLLPHFRVLMVELPGHGRTPRLQHEVTLRELAQDLGDWLGREVVLPLDVCGYSMGGRLALHLALYAPGVVRGLALIGASAGIAEEAERAARRKADRELAANIRARGIAWFEDYWSNLPLFATQKQLSPEQQRRLREQRLQCDAEGLAYALENLGTGEQEYLGAALGSLSCRLLLLAGAHDEKFCAVNREIERLASGAVIRRVEIAGAGHAAHVEQPVLVARELIAFFGL